MGSAEQGQEEVGEDMRQTWEVMRDDIEQLKRKVAELEARLQESERTRGTRLRPNWEPSEATRQWIQREGYPEQWVDTQFHKFHDYWQSISGKRGIKLNWDSTFRNWLRNAAEWKSTKNDKSTVRAARDLGAR